MGQRCLPQIGQEGNRRVPPGGQSEMDDAWQWGQARIDGGRAC